MDDTMEASYLLVDDNARKALLAALRIVSGNPSITLLPEKDNLALNLAGLSAITVSAAMNRVERQFGITVGCAAPETTIGEVIRRIEQASGNTKTATTGT